MVHTGITHPRLRYDGEYIYLLERNLDREVIWIHLPTMTLNLNNRKGRFLIKLDEIYYIEKTRSKNGKAGKYFQILTYDGRDFEFEVCAHNDLGLEILTLFLAEVKPDTFYLAPRGAVVNLDKLRSEHAIVEDERTGRIELYFERWSHSIEFNPETRFGQVLYKALLKRQLFGR